MTWIRVERIEREVLLVQHHQQHASTSAASAALMKHPPGWKNPLCAGNAFSLSSTSTKHICCWNCCCNCWALLLKSIWAKCSSSTLATDWCRHLVDYTCHYTTADDGTFFIDSVTQSFSCAGSCAEGLGDSCVQNVDRKVASGVTSFLDPVVGR